MDLDISRLFVDIDLSVKHAVPVYKAHNPVSTALYSLLLFLAAIALVTTRNDPVGALALARAVLCPSASARHGRAGTHVRAPAAHLLACPSALNGLARAVPAEPGIARDSVEELGLAPSVVRRLVAEDQAETLAHAHARVVACSRVDRDERAPDLLECKAENLGKRLRRDALAPQLGVQLVEHLADELCARAVRERGLDPDSPALGGESGVRFDMRVRMPVTTTVRVIVLLVGLGLERERNVAEISLSRRDPVRDLGVACRSDLQARALLDRDGEDVIVAPRALPCKAGDAGL